MSLGAGANLSQQNHSEEVEGHVLPLVFAFWDTFPNCDSPNMKSQRSVSERPRTGTSAVGGEHQHERIDYRAHGHAFDALSWIDGVLAIES
jgi:hypothetical protein